MHWRASIREGHGPSGLFHSCSWPMLQKGHRVQFVGCQPKVSQLPCILQSRSIIGWMCMGLIATGDELCQLSDATYVPSMGGCRPLLMTAYSHAAGRSGFSFKCSWSSLRRNLPQLTMPFLILCVPNIPFSIRGLATDRCHRKRHLCVLDCSLLTAAQHKTTPDAIPDHYHLPYPPYRCQPNP